MRGKHARRRVRRQKERAWEEFTRPLSEEERKKLEAEFPAKMEAALERGRLDAEAVDEANRYRRVLPPSDLRFTGS